MTVRIPASEVVVGDLIETPWNATFHRVFAVELTPSKKTVTIRTTVENSTAPLMYEGRTMTHTHRVSTGVLVHRRRR